MSGYQYSFDIDSVLQFKPPRRMCKRCLALHYVMPGSTNRDRLICPICQASYIPSDGFSINDAQRYFDEQGLAINFQDLMGHSRVLAHIAQSARKSLNSSGQAAQEFPPMRALLAAMLEAQEFVHFTTYGISHVLIGAIKIVAQRVAVRGIISNADARVVRELREHKDEAPGLDVKVFERSTRSEEWEASPHQKIVVIDGLLAFKGSANLTTEGWRKAAQGRDFIEVVTDIREVVDLHNRLFSRVWGEHSEVKSDILMGGQDSDV